LATNGLGDLLLFIEQVLLFYRQVRGSNPPVTFPLSATRVRGSQNIEPQLPPALNEWYV
jgi:hypothetical protein